MAMTRTVSRAALVTGCSSGIGRAAAVALREAGFPVVATARRPGSLDDLVERGIATQVLDVTDEVSMRAAVDAVEAQYGAVGVLVNNAGYALQSTIEEAEPEAVRRQLETNLLGPARLIQLALPGMRAQGWGRIVNVGSMGGRFTFPGGGWYHASKHALEAISDAVRLEVAAFGVTVSLIEPGPVRTGFGEAAIATIPPESGDDGPYAAFNAELALRYAQAYDPGGRGKVAPAEVAAAIVAAAGDHPRSRYAVGVVAKALITGRRLSPDLVWDGLMRRSWPTPR